MRYLIVTLGGCVLSAQIAQAAAKLEIADGEVYSTTHYFRLYDDLEITSNGADAGTFKPQSMTVPAEQSVTLSKGAILDLSALSASTDLSGELNLRINNATLINGASTAYDASHTVGGTPRFANVAALKTWLETNALTLNADDPVKKLTVRTLQLYDGTRYGQYSDFMPYSSGTTSYDFTGTDFEVGTEVTTKGGLLSNAEITTLMGDSGSTLTDAGEMALMTTPTDFTPSTAPTTDEGTRRTQLAAFLTAVNGNDPASAKTALDAVAALETKYTTYETNIDAGGNSAFKTALLANNLQSGIDAAVATFKAWSTDTESAMTGWANASDAAPTTGGTLSNYTGGTYTISADDGGDPAASMTFSAKNSAGNIYHNMGETARGSSLGYIVGGADVTPSHDLSTHADLFDGDSNTYTLSASLTGASTLTVTGDSAKPTVLNMAAYTVPDLSVGDGVTVASTGTTTLPAVTLAAGSSMRFTQSQTITSLSTVAALS